MVRAEAPPTHTHPPSPETSPPTASCPLYYPSASSPCPLGNECAWFSALPSLTRKFGRFFSHKLLAAAHISVVLKLSREVFFSAALFFFSPPSTKCKAGRAGRVLSESEGDKEKGTNTKGPSSQQMQKRTVNLT